MVPDYIVDAAYAAALLWGVMKRNAREDLCNLEGSGSQDWGALACTGPG